MPGFVGLPEILLLGLVVLLVFGPKRLPEMGRSLGRGLREFKDSVSGDHKDEHDRFTVPTEEPQLLAVGSTQAPQSAGASPRASAVMVVDRTLSPVVCDDERVA
ncbi:MAG: twin-arginine translocase TatA/TatE family subunit [Gaiellaceae bacterium]